MLSFNLRGKTEKVLFQHLYNSLALHSVTFSRTLKNSLSVTPFFTFSSTQDLTLLMTSSSISNIEKQFEVPYIADIEGPNLSDGWTYVPEPPMKMENQSFELLMYLFHFLL